MSYPTAPVNASPLYHCSFDWNGWDDGTPCITLEESSELEHLSLPAPALASTSSTMSSTAVAVHSQVSVILPKSSSLSNLDKNGAKKS